MKFRKWCCFERVEAAVRKEGGEQKGYTIHFGYRPVRVPGRDEQMCLVALVLCAAYFAAICLGETINLTSLLHKVIKAPKRIFGVPAHY